MVVCIEGDAVLRDGKRGKEEGKDGSYFYCVTLLYPQTFVSEDEVEWHQDQVSQKNGI